MALILAGYLGAMLLGGSLLAIGSFISSLTENQLIAAVLSFGAFLMLWVIDFAVRGSDSVAGQVLQYLSVIHHYDDFTRGIIDTSGLIYYVSFPILFHFPHGALGGFHSLETRMMAKPSGPINRHGWAELAATIGAACLIAGYLRFTIQGEWLRTSEILAIGGGVLLLAGIAFGFDAILAFFSKRSSRLGTNTTILTRGRPRDSGHRQFCRLPPSQDASISPPKSFTRSRTKPRKSFAVSRRTSPSYGSPSCPTRSSTT